MTLIAQKYVAIQATERIVREHATALWASATTDLDVETIMVCDKRFTIKNVNIMFFFNNLMTVIFSIDTDDHTTFHFKIDTTVKTTPISNVTEDSYSEKAILGILLVLCGLCAGVIFYKQCRRRNFTAVKQQEDHLGYNKSFNELVVNNFKSDEAVDPTYLDPVHCYRSADSIDIEVGRLSVENISSGEETLNV